MSDMAWQPSASSPSLVHGRKKRQRKHLAKIKQFLPANQEIQQYSDSLKIESLKILIPVAWNLGSQHPIKTELSSSLAVAFSHHAGCGSSSGQKQLRRPTHHPHCFRGTAFESNFGTVLLQHFELDLVNMEQRHSRFTTYKAISHCSFAVVATKFINSGAWFSRSGRFRLFSWINFPSFQGISWQRMNQIAIAKVVLGMNFKAQSKNKNGAAFVDFLVENTQFKQNWNMMA